MTVCLKRASDVFAEKPALESIATILAEKHTFWVRDRNYAKCIDEHELTLDGQPISSTQLRRSLCWLVYYGFAKRNIFDPMHFTRDGIEVYRLQRVCIHEAEYRDRYVTCDEHWEFCPTTAFWKWLNAPKQKTLCAVS